MDKTLSLSDRMLENYEQVTQFRLIRRMPVIIRVDGRAFHSLTRKCEKPFDQIFINSMACAARDVSQEMQGFKLAYIQSDEASFLITDYDKLNTQGWFGYELSKIISLSAALMSAHFTSCFCQNGYTAAFDARAFNIPRDEVANYFLHRTQDWQRNSIQMYAQSFFSHKQLHKKNQADMHEMLHEIGKNWATDLTEQKKNGTWLVQKEALHTRYDILPQFSAINEVVSDLIKPTEE